MPLEKLQGAITALITPFTLEGDVDEEGLRFLVNRQVDSGIDGLVILGTTAETPTLSSAEQKRIIAIVVDEVKQRIPILVGTGTYCTKETIEKTAAAKDLGADAAIIVTPYYNKPSQDGIFRHFQAISQAVDLPILLYNIQGRTGVNIETDTVKRLASLDAIIGIKEASGNILQAADVFYQVKKWRPDFAIFSGDDALTLPMMSLGADGVISVVSNLLPQEMLSLVQAATDGDFNLALSWHYRLLPLFKSAFIETNPSPIKAAMSHCSLPAGGCRLPLAPLLPHNLAQIKQLLATYNIDIRRSPNEATILV
jgi:4-hydroxy-tetrahydrodipicolinate synthase